MKRNKLIFENGDKINGLTYLQELPAKRYYTGTMRQALFKCFCSTEFSAGLQNVVKGNTSSCGCLRSESLKVRNKELKDAKKNTTTPISK